MATREKTVRKNRARIKRLVNQLNHMKLTRKEQLVNKFDLPRKLLTIMASGKFGWIKKENGVWRCTLKSVPNHNTVRGLMEVQHEMMYPTSRADQEITDVGFEENIVPSGKYQEEFQAGIERHGMIVIHKPSLIKYRVNGALFTEIPLGTSRDEVKEIVDKIYDQEGWL